MKNWKRLTGFCNRKLWLYVLFCLVALPGCRSHPLDSVDAMGKKADYIYRNDVRKALTLIHNGDVITRTGSDLTSLHLCKLSQRDPTYSHCGIASIEHDTVFVYHAVGGELNPNEKLRRDPLSAFVDIAGNTGFGIFRFDISLDEWASVDSVVQDFYRKGTLFDMQFDLRTDNKLYCSEFVAKSFSKGLRAPVMFGTYTLAGKQYVAVDNIFLHPKCKEIKRFRYF